MHNLGLFVIQKNKKTMIKEKGKEICQRVLDTNDIHYAIANPSTYEYNKYIYENCICRVRESEWRCI